MNDKTLDLAVESQQIIFERVWKEIPNEAMRDGRQLFHQCFGVDYDSNISGHKNAYSNLWNFLNRKIKEGYGYKSYINGHKSTIFIKQNKAGEFKIAQKCILTWNQTVGKRVSRENLVNDVESAWLIFPHNSYVGLVFNHLCKLGYGTKEKKGRFINFVVEKAAPIEIYKEILEEKQSKTSAKLEKVAKAGIAMVDSYKLFTESHFQTIGNETFVRIPKDQAIEANEFISSLMIENKILKTELEKSKKTICELLDENKILSTENRVLSEAKVVSIKKRLEELKSQI